MMRSSTTTVVAMLLVGVAACGGSSAGSTAGTASSDTVVPATTPPADDADGGGAVDTTAIAGEDADEGGATGGSAAVETTASESTTDAEDGGDSANDASAPGAPPRSSFGTRVGLGSMLDLAVSPDGSLIVGVGFHRVWLIDVPTMESTTIELGDDSAASVAFDPAGSTFAFGLESGSIEVWDASTRQRRSTLENGYDDWANRLVFSGDGTRLASSPEPPASNSTDTIIVQDVATGQVVGGVVDIDDRFVSDYLLDHGGTTLMMTDRDHVFAVDLETDEQLYDELLVEDASGGVALELSEDGETLFVMVEESVRALDAASGTGATVLAETPTGSPRHLVRHDDGLIVVDGDEISRISLDGANVVGPIPFTEPEFGTFVSDIEVGGDTLVGLMRDHQDIVVVDASNGELIASTTVSAPEVAEDPRAVLLSPSGDRLVMLHDGGTMTVWDLAGPAPELIDRRARVRRPAFDEAGTLYALVSVEPRSNDYDFVDITNGEVLIPAERADDRATYVPDLGIAHVYERDAIRVFDMETDEVVHEFAELDQIVERGVTSDGGHLAAVTAEESLLVWELAGGTLVIDETFPDMQWAVEFGDGKVWVVAEDDSGEQHLRGFDPVTATWAVDVPIGNRNAPFAVTPDGATAVVEHGGDVFAEIISLPAGAVLGEAEAPSRMEDIAVSADGRLLALGTKSGTGLLVDMPGG